MSDDRRHPRRDDIAREVDDELRAHIEMRARDNERAGMDPDEALRAAEEAFGDYARIARASFYERTAPSETERRGRSHRLLAWLDTFWLDLVQTMRGFARNPGLYGAAVLTLAIGLGATTSIYSLANWMLLRPIPGVEAPEDLSHVWVGRMTEEGAFRVSGLSTPNFQDVAERLTTATGIAGFQWAGTSLKTGERAAISVFAAVVTSNYFDVLGVQPRLGRAFALGEDSPGADARVVVISDDLWTSTFDRDPEVLGRTLRLSGFVYTVVGVAPEGFHGTELFEGIDLWVPSGVYRELNHRPDPESQLDRAADWFYMLVVRRAPGATWSQVSDELDGLEAWLADQFPEENSRFSEVGFHVWETFGTAPMGVEVLRRSLLLMMGVSGLVLLIASANVANLLLLRCLGRRSEIALRKALGGSRWRMVRLHLTEGLLLWLLGGIGGLALARVLAGAFEGARVGYATVSGVALDSRVVGFAAASALLVGALFSVLPAAASRRVSGGSALRGSTATAPGRRLWARNGLTALQLAASLTLLVGALLLAQTLANLIDVDPGFEPEGIYVFLGTTNGTSYTPADDFAYFSEIERRMRLQPEVESVAIVDRAPFHCCGSSTRIMPSGADPETAMLTPNTNQVFSSEFFDLLEIPLLRGRTFTREEITAPGQERHRVVVLSEQLAAQLFPGDDAVGRRVEFNVRGDAGLQFEVVGIVGDVYYGDLTAPPEPFVYRPAGGERVENQQHITFRTSAPGRVGEIARDVAAAVDPDLPIGEVQSMSRVLAAERGQWTLLAKLMTLLAGFAAVLSAIGLYGVVAFMVRARSRELGIRMALGATSRELLTQVLRSITVTTAVGLLVGLGGAVALVRVLESQLFGVAPFDPVVWSLAALGMVSVSLVAAFLPARRATRVDPVVTLRAE